MTRSRLFASVSYIAFLYSSLIFAEEITPQNKPIEVNVAVPALKFITYNVLFDETTAAQRLPTIFKFLHESHADIIALQEVTPWFLKALEKEEWTKGLHVTPVDANGKWSASGGLFILSKLPVESSQYHELPSRLNRGVLVAHLKILLPKEKSDAPTRTRSLAIATVHLESPLADIELRGRQMDDVFPLLKNTDDAILLGDFNFRDDDPENKHLDTQYVDLWKALHPNEKGYTWDIERNDLARKNSFPKEGSGRLDHILVRSTHWKPQTIRMIGCDAIKGHPKIFPSDHFGLEGTIEEKNKK
jgi:endonuclease/exonuclease/phosphatase family metal-dependent hydrolase